MNTELQVLAEQLVEILVVVFLFRDRREHLAALIHLVRLDHAEDLVLTGASRARWSMANSPSPQRP